MPQIEDYLAMTTNKPVAWSLGFRLAPHQSALTAALASHRKQGGGE